MPVIKMPDGTNVGFPDNMPKEEIKALISAKFPEVGAATQEQQPLQGVKDFSVGVAGGLAKLPLGAAQLVTGGIEALSDPTEGREVAQTFQSAFNTEVQNIVDQNPKLPFQEALVVARENVRGRGIADPSEVSVSEVGRSQAATVRNIGEAVSTAKETSPIATTIGQLTGEIGQLAPIGAQAKTVSQFAKAGGVTGVVMGAFTPDEKKKEIDKLLSDRAFQAASHGVGGAALGGVLKAGIDVAPTVTAKVADSIGLQNVSRQGKRALGHLFKVNPQLADDAIAAGVEPTIANISTSPALQTYNQFLTKVPIASGIIKKSVDDAIDSISSTIKKSGDFTSPASVQEVSEILTGRHRKWVDTFKRLSEQKYNRLNKIIPETTPVKLRSTSKLQLLSEAEATAPALKEEILSSEGNRILNNILSDLKVGGGEMTYGALRRYRTHVGNKLRDKLINNEDSAMFSRVYGALSEDMRDIAAQRGVESLKLFDDANRFYSAGINRIKNTTERIANPKNIDDVFDFAIGKTKRGDGRIRQIFTPLNSSEREIFRSTFVNRLGRGSEEGRSFSLAKFQTNYDDLSKEAKSVIFGGNKQNLDSIVKMISRNKDIISSFGNPSGTGGVLTAGAIGGGLGTAPVTTSLVIGSNAINAKLLNSPAFTKSLLKAMRSKQPPQSAIGNFIREAKDIAKQEASIAEEMGILTTKIGIATDAVKNGGK